MHQKRNVVVVAPALFLLAVAFFAYERCSNVKEPMVNTGNSIAVLPFVNMSADSSQDYFSDGLSEQLISNFSRNPKLLVIARTSSFSFKGTQTDLKTIAKKLNVKNILEGSVKKSGNVLSISASLVNAETSATLWSNKYSGSEENIFALQDSISGSIADALQTALPGQEVKASVQKTSPEAYRFFLLGKHFYSLSGKENFAKAEEYFQQCLRIDPGFAPCWILMSLVHSNQADQGYIPVGAGYGKAKREVQRALALDPNSADAHAQFGWIKNTYDWDWEGADQEYKQTMQLEPGNSGVIGSAASLSLTLGRYAEAIRLGRRSIEIDPLSDARYFFQGLYDWYAGRYAESLSDYRKCIELNPQFPGAHAFLGRVYLTEGKLDSALIEMNRETEPDWKMQGLAIVYYGMGRKKEADDQLASYIKVHQNDVPFQIAEVYGWRGEADSAFHWLDRAYTQRDAGLAQMRGDPLMGKVEKGARYAAFLRKMKLPL